MAVESVDGPCGPLKTCVRCGTGWTARPGFRPACPRCEDDWDHLCQLISADLRFCGCGDPAAAYALVRDLLGCAEAYWADGAVHREAAQKARELAGSDGAYYLLMYLLDHAGLTQHATMIDGAWLTPKGRHYLSLLRMHDYADLREAGYPHTEGYPDCIGVCGPGCRHWDACQDPELPGSAEGNTGVTSSAVATGVPAARPEHEEGGGDD